jgi:hypothetical protein
VLGTDLDVQAITASRDNAEKNRVEAAFCLPDVLPGGEFDILVANILTNPLKALMPLLAARVRPGGRIALSGILAEQASRGSGPLWRSVRHGTLGRGRGLGLPGRDQDGNAPCRLSLPRMPAPLSGSARISWGCAGALVRCGKCNAVFNAYDTLLAELEEPPATTLFSGEPAHDALAATALGSRAVSAPGGPG